jgi:CRP-like cAMP-binding protein
MTENFRKYLESKIQLTGEDLTLISSHCLVKNLSRKQYLLQAGEAWNYHAFVSKGFLKLYYVDEKDQERILQFAPENYWTSDRESMVRGLPSRYNIDAIEASEVVLITNAGFETLRKKIPVFDEFVNQTLSRNVIALQERIHVSITYTAEEKYNNFVEQFTHIANRIPLHMIASYLGISPETLSRIRHNSLKK